MEDNLRSVLIIISAIVITALFVHGLWTIRKEKNPYKLKTSKNKVEPIARDFDQKGFDQDGVSQVKVSKNIQNTSAESEEVIEPASITTANEEVELGKSQVIQQSDILSATAKLTTSEVEQDVKSEPTSSLDDRIESDWFKDDLNESLHEETPEESNKLFTNEELGDELTPVTNTTEETVETQPSKPKKTIEIEPLYEQPITQAKPNRAAINKGKRKPSKAELRRDQMEIDFDNQPNVEPIKPKIKQEKLEPQVIILSVVMPVNQQMFGAALLPSLLTLGLKYGEMNIFHRHEDNAGHGKVTFSLANIMNPGSFDLDTMENFATRGVSLFMTLPNAGDSFAVFEQMLNAAKQLAQEFNAQVLDDKRNVMTKQTEQHYLSKIREFDRKSRIADVE